MEFIEMAMQMELEGVEHYRKLAQNCQPRELAGIFNFFEKEELLHFEIFKAWQNKTMAPEPVKHEISRKVIEIFKSLTKDIKNLGIPAIDHDDAYHKALILEKNSIAYYTEMQARIYDPEQKRLLTYLLGQEEMHLRLVQSLMEFQRHPYEWLENAEWRHIEDY